jgi:hypothetical protein
LPDLPDSVPGHPGEQPGESDGENRSREHDVAGFTVACGGQHPKVNREEQGQDQPEQEGRQRTRAGDPKHRDPVQVAAGSCRGKGPGCRADSQSQGKCCPGELQAARKIEAQFAGDAGSGDQGGAQVQGNQVAEPIEELLPRRAVQSQFSSDRVRRRGRHLIVAVAAGGDAEGDVAGEALDDGEARRRDEQDHRGCLDATLSKDLEGRGRGDPGCCC